MLLQRMTEIQYRGFIRQDIRLPGKILQSAAYSQSHTEHLPFVGQTG